MEKFIRCLDISNVSIKFTGNDPSGFVSLFDDTTPYIQNIESEVIWRLNIDDITFERGRKNQYYIRLGPNPWFVPEIGFRAGFLTKTKLGLKFEDSTEVLVFSEALFDKLIQIKKEQVSR